MLKTEPRAPCGKHRGQHDRNVTAEFNFKNLLPPGRGPMLRDGPALAIPGRDGETGPVARLWRKGILIPDLMVAFEINVAGVIARRGYPMLSQRGAPAFLAWVGAPGKIQGSRQVARIWRGLHAMRTLKASGATPG